MSVAPSLHSNPGLEPVGPGDVLGGKYRVIRVIGKGGMGVVVEAERLDLGERVAIKVMHERYTSNAEAMARFDHEARSAVKIRGEHVARVIDVGTAENGAPYIVMELLEGCDLATLQKQGPMGITDAVLYILQACAGMAEVHVHGIIHRDLKPGNLFLTRRPDGTPLLKVLDFGIAKSASPADTLEPAMTMTMVSLGTPLYMSPEQVRCSKTVDSRTDVWSLGAILYELLAGIPAFGGNSVANISAQVLESNPPLLTLMRPDVSPKLEKVVQKALSKRPEQRYADVASFAAALAPFGGPLGAAHAARTMRILRGDGFSTTGGGRPSVPPAAPALPPEAATTLRFTHRRERLLHAGIGAVIVAMGLLGALGIHAYRTTVSVVPVGPALKGLRAASDLRFAVAITAARVGRAAAPQPAAPAAVVDPPISVIELPPAPPRGGGKPARGPAGGPRGAPRNDDLHPLETRK